MVLFISILVLIFSSILFVKASGSLRLSHMNIISYTYYTLIIWVFIGSIFIYYNIALSDMVSSLSESKGLFGWIGIMYMMIALPLSMIFINHILNVNANKSLIKYYRTSLEPVFNYGDAAVKWSLYLLSITASILLIIEVVPRLNTLPIYNRFFSNILYGSMNLYEQRMSARLFDPNTSRLMPLFISIIPICTYISFSYWLRSKLLRDYFWFIFLFAITVFIQVFDLAKARIMFFLIGMVIVYLLSGGKLKKKTLVIFTFVGLIGVGLTYIFFMGLVIENKEIVPILGILISAMSGRIFVGQIAGYYHSLDIFPTLYPFLEFSSTGRLIHELFGLDFSPDYGIITKYVLSPNAIVKGPLDIGHYTTFFMGEAWANFGLMGLILAPLFVGFTLQLIHIFFIQSKKTPLHIGFYTTLILSMPILSSFQAFYYPMWLLSNLFIVIIILGLAFLIKGAVK
jgi:hypothetical protein